MAQTIKLKRSATQGAAPTTSNLELGEVAINTYDGKMYIKKNVGGTESIVQIGGSGSVSYLEAGMIEYEYTASSNQTTFSGSDSNSATLSYTANSIMVFLNGVLQDDGVDYTATNGTSVVFSSALTANDEVRIVAFTNVTNTSTLNNPTKLDAITTVNNQAAYSLTVNSSAYAPSSQNALIVSLNGITQEPGDSFTISGSTITFSPALVTGDVVDYIVDMGRTVTIGEYDSDLVVTGDITPGADSTYDLGASGTEWANVYADTFTGNLTGNVTGTVSSLSNHDTDDLSEGSTNLYFTTSRVDSHLSGGTGVTYNAGEISIGQDVSTTATPTFGNITTTGYIAGPSTFTIDPAAVGDNTGTLVVAGNLQVDGTTTTINSTTMTVDDLNITLASGAANAAAANGAGITVDGASATLTYNSTPDAWSFNKNLGIGTSSPDGTLHVKDTIAQVYIQSNDGQPAQIVFGDASDASRGRINYDSSDNIIFENSNLAERMRIDSAGRVNIGTGAPDSNITFGIDNQGFVVARYDLSAGVPTAGLGGVFSAAANVTDFSSGDLVLQSRPGVNSRSIKFFTGNTSAERMRIKADGNVGIGNTNATYILDVDVGAPASSDQVLGRFSSQNGVRDIGFVWDDSTSTLGIATLTNHALTFHTNGNSNERMRIDSSGNVGIGISSVSPVISSSKTLQVSSSGNTTLSVRAIDSVNDRSAILELLSSGNGLSKSIILYGDTDTSPSTASPLVIQKYHSGARTEVGRFNTSGHLVLGDSTTAYYRLKSGATGTDGGIQWMFNTDATVFGSLTLPYDSRATTGLHLYSGYPITYTVPSNKAHQFITGSSEAARIDADGMKFNGDTAAANALDDYEEGTFTPTFTYSGGTGTGSWTYSNRTGRYTKIGNVCYYAIDIRFSSYSKGTASGQPQISDLPFTPANFANYNRVQTSVVLYQWPYTTNDGYFPGGSPQQQGSINRIDLSMNRPNLASVYLDDPDANSMIFASGYYYTV